MVNGFDMQCPFRIYQLVSTANPAKFYSKRVGLAMLMSKQILNSSQDLNTISMALLVPIISISKPLTIQPPPPSSFLCITFCLQLVWVVYEQNHKTLKSQTTITHQVKSTLALICNISFIFFRSNLCSELKSNRS